MRAHNFSVAIVILVQNILLDARESLSSCRVKEWLSFGIVPKQEMDSSVDASTNFTYINQMAFFPYFLSGATFLTCFFFRLMLLCWHFLTLSKARTPLLSRVLSPHSRPLHPAAQVLCITGSTIITTMSSSDFSYCIGLAFPSGYTSATCSPSPEFIDPETCRR